MDNSILPPSPYLFMVYLPYPTLRYSPSMNCLAHTLTILLASSTANLAKGIRSNSGPTNLRKLSFHSDSDGVGPE